MWSKTINISSDATKQWKSILLIYAVQFLLGLIVSFIALIQFDNSIGTSLELDRLARGFDRSIFSDLINEFPEIINQIQSRFVLIALLFFPISIFFHAGLLGNTRKNEYSIASFVQNAKKYYVRFLGIVLISVLKLVVVLSIIWVPFFMYLGNPLESFHSEKTFILTLIALIVLSALFIIVIWLWSILSRYQIVDGDLFVAAMKRGWKILKSNFVRYYILGIGLLMLHIVITWLYTFVVDDWGAESWYYLLGLISIQQIFSVIRIWIRAFAYAGVHKV